MEDFTAVIKQHNYFYFKIPQAVSMIILRELSNGTCYRIYQYIYNYWARNIRDDRFFSIGYQKIYDYVGCHRNTVSKWMQFLIQEGWLQVRNYKGRESSFKLSMPQCYINELASQLHDNTVLSPALPPNKKMKAQSNQVPSSGISHDSVQANRAPKEVAMAYLQDMKVQLKQQVADEVIQQEKLSTLKSQAMTMTQEEEQERASALIELQNMPKIEPKLSTDSSTTCTIIGQGCTHTVQGCTKEVQTCTTSCAAPLINNIYKNKNIILNFDAESDSLGDKSEMDVTSASVMTLEQQSEPEEVLSQTDGLTQAWLTKQAVKQDKLEWQKNKSEARGGILKGKWYDFVGKAANAPSRALQCVLMAGGDWLRPLKKQN